MRFLESFVQESRRFLLESAGVKSKFEKIES